MKFDHILFPVDFSDHCRALARPVAQLATLFEARLTLLHVADIPRTCYAATEAYYDWETSRVLADRLKRNLQEFAIALPASRVERVTVEGDPADEIVAYAKQQKLDLIYMGTHGCGTLRGLLLGSVAQTVICKAHCPVWVQSAFHPPVSARDRLVSNIVCALELTDKAVPMLRFTAELAAKTGANVFLLRSIPELETTEQHYISPNLRDFLLQTATQEIRELQQTAESDFPVSLTGERISEAIARAAQEHQAELVIIGRGKSQAVFGRLRTHAYDIIRHTPCSVLSCSFAASELAENALRAKAMTA